MIMVSFKSKKHTQTYLQILHTAMYVTKCPLYLSKGIFLWLKKPQLKGQNHNWKKQDKQ